MLKYSTCWSVASQEVCMIYNNQNVCIFIQWTLS